VHLRAGELCGQQLDGCRIDLAPSIPAVGDEVDVLGSVHRAQRGNAMVHRVADVEVRVEHAPVQQSIALGALGMRDGLAAPKEALRVVVERSCRVIDAHQRRCSVAIVVIGCKCAQNHHPVQARLEC
jgi:hypothetical protein